jgi:hypothetical protein
MPEISPFVITDALLNTTERLPPIKAIVRTRFLTNEAPQSYALQPRLSFERERL